MTLFVELAEYRPTDAIYVTESSNMQLETLAAIFTRFYNRRWVNTEDLGEIRRLIASLEARFYISGSGEITPK